MQMILDAIELYLGIGSEIKILREGAPVDDPVTLRQMILYMDEEFGDPRPNAKTGQPGLDFQTVEDFDKWLMIGKHIDQVLPERKGVVAIKPSRQKRHYDDSPFLNNQINDNNKMTYLLVRNGENIYRIFTGIEFSERLYPKQVEMEAVIKSLEEDDSQRNMERINKGEYVYRRNALIIQGLLDRTTIFYPLAHETSLLKPDTYPGCINFVRDDEMTLQDGRPSFKEWQKEINAKIQVGSRVLWIHPNYMSSGYYANKDFKYHFLRYYHNDNYPPPPNTGVYQVETEEEYYEHGMKDRPKHKRLIFLYNPGDEVSYGNAWSYDPHPRKNRISFILSSTFTHMDNFLNYDQIELEDIEYYLNNRYERKNFLDMVTILWELRDQLMAEREKEKAFVRLVASRNNIDDQVIWDAVSIWKFRNKWKRRIDSDDAKALRMIEKRIKNKHENN